MLEQVDGGIGPFNALASALYDGIAKVKQTSCSSRPVESGWGSHGSPFRDLFVLPPRLV